MVDDTILSLLHFRHLEQCQYPLNKRSINVFFNVCINYYIIIHILFMDDLCKCGHTYTNGFGNLIKGEKRA